LFVDSLIITKGFFWWQLYAIFPIGVALSALVYFTTVEDVINIVQLIIKLENSSILPAAAIIRNYRIINLDLLSFRNSNRFIKFRWHIN